MDRKIEVNQSYLNRVPNEILTIFSDRGKNIGKGKGQKGNDKQKLDQQFQKIQNIMKKRNETKESGGDYHKVKY